MYAIRVRDIAGEADLDDCVENTTGEAVWTARFAGLPLCRAGRGSSPVAGDAASARRRRRATTSRSSRKPIPPGSSPSAATRLGRAAMISVHGHDASETHVVDLDDPAAPPRLIAPRRPGFRYEAMDHGDVFYIRANSGGAADFQDRRRAARGARGGQLASVRAAPAGAADRARLARSRTSSSCWRARTTCRVSSSTSSPTASAHEIAFEAQTYSLALETGLRVRFADLPLQLRLDGLQPGDLRLRHRRSASASCARSR